MKVCMIYVYNVYSIIEREKGMRTIEDRNYFNDPRTQGPAAEDHILYYHNEATGDNEVITLPTCWKVCDVCHGEGKHVNPSIDCGGISDEMEDDPDFREDYLSGVYDVRCYTCLGKRVIKGVNWEALSEDHRLAYEEQLDYEDMVRREAMAELRMGA